MIGNEEDFTACLGLEVEGADENLSELDTGCLPADDRAGRRRSSRTSPSSRRRCAPSAAPPSTTGRRSPGRAPPGSSKRPHGRGWRSSTASAAATASPPASSTGSCSSGDLQRAVEYGAAHGALAMTTPGDTSTATLAEVEALVARRRRPGKALGSGSVRTAHSGWCVAGRATAAVVDVCVRSASARSACPHPRADNRTGAWSRPASPKSGMTLGGPGRRAFVSDLCQITPTNTDQRCPGTGAWMGCSLASDPREPPQTRVQPNLQAGGRRFEPGTLHHRNTRKQAAPSSTSRGPGHGASLLRVARG